MERRKLVIELANKCNNNCVFCTSDREKGKKIDFYIREIKKAAKNNIRTIDFNGSEPTLNPDVLRLIRTAKNNGFVGLNLFTNGRIFCVKGNIERFVRTGINKVLFSVYSTSKNVHDNITQVNGSLNQTLKGIENAVKLKKKISNLAVGVNLTISEHNYKDLKRTIKEMAAKKVDFINIMPVIPSLFRENQITLQKEPIINSGLLRSISKYKGKKIKFSMFPKCKVNGASSNVRGKKIKIACSDGNIRYFKDIMSNYTTKDKNCDKCRDKKECFGHLKNINKCNFFTLWCASDLHTSKKSKKIVSSILNDLKRVHFNKGIIAGDFVNGELDPPSYGVYSKLIKESRLKNQLFHLAGNHEYTIERSKGCYGLNIYRKKMSKRLNYSIQFGNVAVFLVSMDSSPLKIKKQTISWLKTKVKKNKDKIIVVASHLPSEELKIKDLDGVNVWLHGHNSVKNNGKHVDCFKKNGCYHIYCGVNEVKSKFLVFENGKDKAILKRRDHNLKKFVNQEVISINKIFKLNKK